MAQYNLIDIGTLNSNTTSGTGNVVLSEEELRLLYNDDTTNSGIALGPSNVLYLDVDIGYRIKIDDVQMFIDIPGDRATALLEVDFYYKNNEGDSFILCSKDQDEYTFFPVDLPDIFAPRFFRVVISNIQATIYELQLYNDDTQVSFGEDGNKTIVIVDHLEDEYTSLAIFNNSSIGTQAVTGYVMVDYQGLESDYYIKIANHPDGPYYGLEDGIVLKDNDTSSSMIWDQGTYEDTEVDLETESVISINHDDGYYTTPIFSMGDDFNSSFIISDILTVSGARITYGNLDGAGDIMKINSSNTPPIEFSKLFWLYTDDTTEIVVLEANMQTGNVESRKAVLSYASSDPERVIFDRNTSQYIVIIKTSTLYFVTKYSYSTNQLIASSSSSAEFNIAANIDVDVAGNVWGYSQASGFKLLVFNAELSGATTVRDDGPTDFLGDLSADKQYSSCWYTDQIAETVHHVRAENTEIISINVPAPTYICSILDGGCIVVSNDYDILRYNYYGDLEESFTFSQTFPVMDISYGIYSEDTAQDKRVFWVLMGSTVVVKISFDGEMLTETTLTSISSIEAFAGGCIAYSSSVSKAYLLNTDGGLSRTWDFSSYSNKGKTPIPVFIEYDEFVNMHNPESVFPVVNDPIWYNISDWLEVPTSGYKLPIRKYHQTKYKFNSEYYQIPLYNPGADLGNISGWTANGNFSATSGYYYSPDYGFYSNREGAYGEKWIHGYQRITLASLPFEIHDNTRFFGRAKQITNTGGVAYTCGIGLRFRKGEFYTTLHTEYGEPIGNLSWHFSTVSASMVHDAEYIEIFAYGIRVGTYNSFVSDDFELYVWNRTSLDKVIIPRPIQVPDIHPQEYKNIYIKTEFPEVASYQEYNSRLRCWWGNKEE